MVGDHGQPWLTKHLGAGALGAGALKVLWRAEQAPSAQRSGAAGVLRPRENEAQTLQSGVQGKVTPYCLLLFIAASSVLAGKSAQPVHVIPFEMYRNAVWLPVGANGSEPLSFIVIPLPETV